MCVTAARYVDGNEKHCGSNEGGGDACAGDGGRRNLKKLGYWFLVEDGSLVLDCDFGFELHFLGCIERSYCKVDQLSWFSHQVEVVFNKDQG